MDESKGLTDVLRMSNSTGTAGISHGDSAGTYLGAQGVEHVIDATDSIGSQSDAPSGHWDMPSVSNGAGMAGMSCGEGASTYLGVRDATRVVDAMNGVGSRMDALTGPTDVPCVRMDAITPENTSDIISTPRKRMKPPDLPIGAAKRTPDKPNSCGDHTDGPSVCKDVHSIGTGTQTAANETEHVRVRQIGLQTKNSPVENEQPRSDEPDGCRSHADRSSTHMDRCSIGNTTEMAENEAETVRMRQTDKETQDSPNACEITTPKPTIRWKKVSAGGIDIYIPQNALIETASQIFVFG